IGGFNAVYWRQLGWMTSSWILSPLLNGVISYAIFRAIQLVNKLLILRTAAGPSSYNQTENIEKIFIPMQILSACFFALSHGANAVANAIGPAAAVLCVLKTQTIGAAITVPVWLLALGGIGVITGLATWRWRIIETVGKNITEL